MQELLLTMLESNRKITDSLTTNPWVFVLWLKLSLILLLTLEKEILHLNANLWSGYIFEIQMIPYFYCKLNFLFEHKQPRPFGVALLIAGVDESGPRLFKTGTLFLLISWNVLNYSICKQKIRSFWYHDRVLRCLHRHRIRRHLKYLEWITQQGNELVGGWETRFELLKAIYGRDNYWYQCRACGNHCS